MRRSDFSYELPEDLVAQRPLADRSASRLLVLEPQSGAVSDRRFRDLPELLRPGDLLVFNDTRVIPARLYGRKDSGGRVEVLIERFRDEHTALAHVRASKPPRVGSTLMLEGDARVAVVAREEELFVLRLQGLERFTDMVEAAGHMPLPPYIKRPDDAVDRERYQTVYAQTPGAVAAPTAGLHFDKALLEALRQRGVTSATITLHVGAGTFQPVREEELERHRMHAETLLVSQETVDRVQATRQAGGRVVAVGTTAVRALESAWGDGGLAPYAGETRLFIRPGYRFHAVDALITNFHLPESSLLMLVCAFGGYEQVMAAYQHAVAERYRFYSYGDAMFMPAPAPGAVA